MAEEHGHASHFKNLKYVDREEDPELKQKYEQAQASLHNLHKTLEDQVDGEINVDLHGNVEMVERTPEGGISEAGTYVLRNGKLVPGKGMMREEATFTNWYCSNADPEDIRKHRELMDRMNYKGP